MKKNEKLNRLTNEMVILADMLESVVTDLISELRKEGLFNYEIKHSAKTINFNSTKLRELISVAYKEDMEAQISFGETADYLLSVLRNERDKF